VTIPASGTGTATPVVATDDVSGVHYQYMKIADGTADSVYKAIVTSVGHLLVAHRTATATCTNVASSASNVTLLSLNAARNGATIYNDSTSAVYVKLGSTASASSFTVKMGAGGYYEVPFGYTGQIDAMWVSANGSARMTELT
jgi:hypothetical protein